MLIVFLILILGLLTPRLAGRLAVPVEKMGKWIFYGAIVAIFSVQWYSAWQQYSLWKYGGPPASYLLPPYQPISYFYLYAYMQFFNKFVISCFAAFLILIAAKILNYYFKKRFFEDEEPYFSALSVFLLGQPLWLFYAPAILGSAVLASVYNQYFRKKRGRLSLYYLWTPAGIFLLLLVMALKAYGAPANLLFWLL
ncbi:MAG: hypothetical protein HYW34_01960 [Candidatus Brennerbacteria bacterium]|nr:hypothetical protein [Candidatus Brennerbacteria bacterium]